MKKTLIRIVRNITNKGGWICISENGEKPFGNRIHPSYKAALADLDAAYHGHRVTDSRTRKQVYEIDID